MSSTSNLKTLLLGAALCLPGVMSVDECFDSTSESWSDIGNVPEILEALYDICNNPGVTNKNYTLYDGKTQCVPVNDNHSFFYQFSFDDPETLPPGEEATFTPLNCIELGRAVVETCPHGGQLSLIPCESTINITIRADPWSGSHCTGNGSNGKAKSRRDAGAGAGANEARSAIPVPGIEYDGCYNGSHAVHNVTWEMISDLSGDAILGLREACAAGGGMGNRTYTPTCPGVEKCINTTNGGFNFKIQGVAPWWNGTTVPHRDAFLSVGGCINLGMEAIFKCDYGGYYTSMVIGPTYDGTGQISANVGVEPGLGDFCHQNKSSCHG